MVSKEEVDTMRKFLAKVDSLHDKWKDFDWSSASPEDMKQFLVDSKFVVERAKKEK
jgi:hypothetical protein